VSTLVIGATGTVGSLLTAALAESGVDARAASRGGEVRFDWYDADTWDAALDTVDRMYLIAPDGDAEPLTAMRPFLDRALESGVKRAVLQSGSPISVGDPGLGRVHAAVAETFPEWAVLRPSWFMQNFSGSHVQSEAIRTHGRLTSATRSGRVGFIDARDIAAVAAAALTSDISLDRDPVLTGPAALSYDDVAAVISRASGRAITHVEVSEDRLREIWEADGLPADYAAMLARLDGLIATGAEDRVTDEVLRITGRPPTSFERFAAETRW
jgi:uncharacterized protein YbjT (DUF2867 family)